MKVFYITTLISLLVGSDLFAMNKAFEGAEFSGTDSISGNSCYVKIEKIDKSFLVDNISISVRIGKSTHISKISLGVYDIVNNYYVGDDDQDEYIFNTSKDGKIAKYAYYYFNRDGFVDMPAFSSGQYVQSCNDLVRTNLDATHVPSIEAN